MCTVVGSGNRIGYDHMVRLCSGFLLEYITVEGLVILCHIDTCPFGLLGGWAGFVFIECYTATFLHIHH